MASLKDKCIGIISYFPDNSTRHARISKFKALLENLSANLCLPIVIIAQNWKDDVNIEYKNTIYLYKYSHKLGVTGARIKLREKLLKTDYKYFIFLDDDSVLNLPKDGVKRYLEEIDSHPNQCGKMFGDFFRLNTMPRELCEKFDFDFIKSFESIRGEIWEDAAWCTAYAKAYPECFYRHDASLISEQFTRSEKDPLSTWWRNEFTRIGFKTREIARMWYEEIVHRDSKSVQT